MAWRIELAGRARQQLRKLDREHARSIAQFLTTRLAALDDPRHTGAALQHGSGTAFWRYRVGDFRLIVRIEDDILRVLVIRIAHQREAYRHLPPA